MALLFGPASMAHAAEPTPGYPEAVVQWGVQKGETCEQIAKVLYGSAKHVRLMHRYNRITCAPGAPLPDGQTLVLPAEVTEIPDARIRSINPDVRARPAGGEWRPAAPGMPLHENANVNTLDKGRADVEFVDRTRVFLAPNTLVVIYGSASRSRVSKAPPAAVEVASGEVKAALAALRGEPVEVAVLGGGRVSAASRDTVVQRKGDRTTVAVFDGKAGVSSGGRSVEVPKDHGTRFVGRAPPSPPRPLPPAPAWDAAGMRDIALAPAGEGVLWASWRPAPGAIGYRVEVARDEAFNDLVVREEVPRDIVSFRGEKMPSGAYFLRVRVIDQEEYLGVGAVRPLHLVAVKTATGVTPKPQEITASPYGVLELAPSGSLQMAMDQGPFGPIPERIDLMQRAPKELRLRERGGANETAIAIQYTKVDADIQASRAADGRVLDVRVTLSGLEGVDVAGRVAPRLRAHLPGGVAEIRPAVAQGAAALAAAFPLPETTPARVRLDVVDGRGRVIASTDADLAPPQAGAPRAGRSAALRLPVLGAYVPFLPLSQVTDTLWLGPTPPPVVAVGVAGSSADGAWAAQGQLRASGTLGPIGLDAALRSSAAGERDVASTGWLGVRFRLLRLARTDLGVGTAGTEPRSSTSDVDLELGPSLRVAIPLTDESPPVRIEPGLALGGSVSWITWVVNAGGRFRMADDEGAAGAPPLQGYLLAGATADALPWLRLHAAGELHLVHWDARGEELGGAIVAGVEAGGPIFGALSLRASPSPFAGEGAVTAQLALGIREASP